MKRAALLILIALGGACGAADGEFEQKRERMIEDIRRTAQQASEYGGLAPLDENVLEAVRRVPRHEFVPAGLAGDAYLNRPLPIGEGQTISQPYIVALMTDLADVDEDSAVLEIGTGSGYQAAVLAELARRVYSVEIIETLGRRAEATLRRLGYDNVEVRIGDGYAGWPEHAPFDAIVVTAAPETVPAPLIEQLAPGGRLVIPVGPQRAAQSLRVLTKNADGAIETREVLPVAFVPFLRQD